MSDLRRILYLLRYFPALSESFVREEVEALAARGVELVVASLGVRKGEPMVPSPVIWRVVPRRSLRGWFAPASPATRWLALYQRPKDVRRFHWIRHFAEPFQRVHVHFAGEAAEIAYALKLELGIPYTVTVHAADLFRPRPSLWDVLRNAETVVTISRYNARKLEEMGIKCRVVYCGPDLARWQPIPLPPGPFHAIAVGRNVPKKGFDLLIRAWRNLQGTGSLPPGARLTLVSDFDPGQDVPGLRVVGMKLPAEVRRLIGEAHLGVLPCRRAPDGDMDGIPLFLAESLALARPVLSTRLSGIPELVDEEVGWLIPPDDEAELCRAIREAASDLSEIARRGERGPARLIERGFTLEAQVNGILSVWGL